MLVPDDVEKRLAHYVETRNGEVVCPLGVGTQGTVFAIRVLSHPTEMAVKLHRRDVAYRRELAVFLRLQELEVSEVRGHEVPQLIGFDDELLAIEMTIVSPPFCLDFGGAYLDQPPDYTPEVWRDWREQKSEDFEDDWPAVLEILGEFESFGIYIADVNPGNIRFQNNT
ncbi:hypothetical protein [Planctomycetes bacterium TBK1r]|uniref:Protein kinase domain-containing protein n=1 Tax=Stieleria magnilauensis TaxID=2527963 RepID=A0ABX5XLI2_9BACT|nr:hypothetical protein TBK1r_07420 [Planctomycetes bacterium TBK1r]